MTTTTQHQGVTGEEKRVLSATLVGTAIEWYDFFIYAQAAALILGPLFFAGLASDAPALAEILSFATIGISFLFRPLGAMVCGYMGDRYGRKIVLVLTLILMGAATTLIGLLPTYAQIGIWAPIILVLLRILQGFSAGGEWGGAALMAVEHAPVHRRSFFGAFPQIGVPIGMLLATGTTLLITAVIGKEAYMEWGWRIPFLLSLALIGVGVLIRRAVEESPVFEKLHERRKESSAPMRELFKNHFGTVMQTAFIFVANNAGGYLLIAFVIGYSQKVLGFPPITSMLMACAGATSWLIFTLLGGYLGDKWGRKRTFQVGYTILAIWVIPMWFLMDTKDPALFVLALSVLAAGLGLSYGPQSALYAEMFPAKVRYSGVSVGYALGAILGGAFAPMIASAIMATYKQSYLIGVYLLCLTIISFTAVTMIKKDPQGIDLNK